MSQNDASQGENAASQDEALSRYKSLLRGVQGALLDPCVLVDKARRMVAFNRSFVMLFPRRQARQLEGKNLDDVLTLRFKGDALNPVEACFERSGAVRFDEIQGEVQQGRQFHFVVTATPMMEGDAPVGAWVMLRDVSDEVEMQAKYQDMLKVESQARKELEEQLRERTAELLACNDKLNELQGELMDFAKGLRLPGQGRLISLPRLRQRPLPRAALDAEAERGRSSLGDAAQGHPLDDSAHHSLPSVDISELDDDVDEMMSIDFDPIIDPASELGLDLELEAALLDDAELMRDDVADHPVMAAQEVESEDSADDSTLNAPAPEPGAEDLNASDASPPDSPEGGVPVHEGVDVASPPADELLDHEPEQG